MRATFLALALLLFGPVVLRAELEFFIGERKVKSLSLKALQKITPPQEIRLPPSSSPSNKAKNYRALALGPLLKGVYGKTLEEGEYSQVVYEATDGYQSFATLDTSLEEGGHVAFEDLDVPGSGWEPVGRKKSDPAPYFLMWTGKDQDSKDGYPWPWALAGVRLVKFEKRYPKVFPRGVPKSSAVFRGYELFRARCFRCHAIDRQGGKIGPDLAAPRPILEYRSEDFVRRFIVNPQDFRYSQMPPHTDLSKEQMDSLISYLKYFRPQK